MVEILDTSSIMICIKFLLKK